MPRYLHTCVSYHKSLEAYLAILEFTPYTIGLIINGTLYVMIIRALSNRTVAETNPNNQVTKIRNQVARLLVINGVVFLIFLMSISLSYRQPEQHRWQSLR